MKSTITGLCRLAMATAITTVFSTSAVSAEKITLRIADPYPTKHVISAQGATFWMKRAEELAGGKIEFQYFPAEQMAKAKGLLQAIETGIVEGGLVPPAYVSEKMPLNGVTMLPGLTQSATDGSLAYHQVLTSGGPLQKEFEQNNVVPMFAFLFPPYQVVSTGKPLRDPAEFKGMKLRSAGGSMNLMVQTLGAVPVSIPTADMYISIERGTIDGTFLSLNAVKSYNLHEVAKSASTNGSFGTFSGAYAINRKTFDKLPKDVQAALIQAGEETTRHLATFLDEDVAQASEAIAAAGIVLYEYTDDERARLSESLAVVENDFLKRMDARKLPARASLDEFRAAVKANAR